MLADVYGFIARSLHDEGKHVVADATMMRPGDVVHFFYSRSQAGKDVHAIGTFGVTTPELHPRPELFGEAIPDTGLFTVVGLKLVAKLDEMRPGYEVDPVLGVWCGWPIVRLKGEKTPRYTKAMMPGFMQTLARYGS